MKVELASPRVVAMAAVMPAYAADVQLLETDAAQSSRPQRRTSLWAHGSHVLKNDSHRVPGSQYVSLCLWLMLLGLLYGWTRLVCHFGVPQDCRADRNGVALMHDAHEIILQGFLLAVLTGLHWPDRFQYVFGFGGLWHRGMLFILCCAAAITVWGLLGMVPGLRDFTLTASGITGWHIWLLVLLCGLGAGLLLWHLWRAFKYNSWAGFAAYILSRVTLVAFYVLYAVVAAQDAEIDFHLHHYAVGFVLASLAEFNHPISVLLLAIGTGIFVQGIATYDADPIISVKEFRIQLGDGNVSPLMPENAVTWVLQSCSSWSSEVFQ